MPTISVTQEDIDQARATTEGSYCSTCPIARAATRAYGLPCEMGCYTLSLYRTTYDRDNGKRVAAFEAPDDAIAWRTAFDYCESVEPFEFTLPDLPEPDGSEAA